MAIRGIEVHYYEVCKRKLWLFNRGIGMETESDRVLEGYVLHQQAYSQLEKNWAPLPEIKIDAVDHDVIREVKMTCRMEKADRLQMLYYLYLLKERGIRKKGLLSYPKEKKTVEVILDEMGERLVKKALAEIHHILQGSVPPVQKKPYCSKCAYRDFCFSGEGESDES